jgi:hypothetical protein
MRTILPFIVIMTSAVFCASSSEQLPPKQFTFRINDRQVIESDDSYNNTPSVAQAENGDWVLSYKKGLNHVKSTGGFETKPGPRQNLEPRGCVFRHFTT